MKHPNINEQLHSRLANSGRAAGMGISYDKYDDESGNPNFIRKDKYPHLPSDYLTPEQLAALNGEVRIYKEHKL